MGGVVGTHFEAKIWCNLDPCGLICAGITGFLIIYAQYTITAAILVPWLEWSVTGLLLFLLYNLLAVAAIVAEIKAMITDPGSVCKDPIPYDEEEAGTGDDEGKAEDETGRKYYRRWCRRCKGYKPPRAHHCSICMRCIIKMDHHCPWVNNCVGALNHKFFLQFIVYVFALCSFTLFLVIARFFTCVYDEENGCGDPGNNMLIVFVILEAILFGLFTSCMILDQWTVVSTNTTSIDRLKGQDNSVNSTFNEVFGGENMDFRIDWLLPSAVEYPADKKNEFFGYVCN
mmetsp:Transcript_22673/g.29449  ORF Transcript_22673/g.29449 Transcript_22673/m.29449 type:complete len:286 (+) Transcript_22673:83-940(+)